MSSKNTKFDSSLVSSAAEKARSIRDGHWASAERLNPALEGLAALLSTAFNVLTDNDSLFDIAIELEEKGIFEEGISDLVAELDFELEDSYGDGWHFDSEYLVDVCDRIARECSNYF